MRWSDVAPALDTGDILLFRDPNDKQSRLIARTVRDPYSHVGMVVRTSDGVPLLWQAVGRGVLLDPLPAYFAQWPATDPGNVVVRHLRVERTPDMISSLHAFMEEVYGRPLLGSNLGQLLAWSAGNHGIDLGEKMFFCAQLVAESWKRLGVLALHPPSSKYSERDYCEAYGSVPFLRGAILSSEVSIELTPDEMAAAKRVPLPKPHAGDKPDVTIGP